MKTTKPELIYYFDPMNRIEFERIRDLPDKRISQDVNFSMKKDARPIYVLEPIPVENSDRLELLLGGTYNPIIQRASFNFFVRGVGPICRFCLNGRQHTGVGRTHKHDLMQEDDPLNNLPSVIDRPDLVGRPLLAAWKTICEQTKIEHTGTLNVP